MLNTEKRAPLRFIVLGSSAAVLIVGRSQGGDAPRHAGEPVAAVGEALSPSTDISVSFPPSVSASDLAIDAANSVGVGPIASITGTVVAMGSQAGGVNIGPQSTFQSDVWSGGGANVGPLTSIAETLHASAATIDPSATIQSLDSNPVFTPRKPSRGPYPPPAPVQET
jgi:hypothetical protein